MTNNFLITILIIAFLIRTVRNSLSLVALWQLKEYRFDRVWIHIRETYQGKQLIFGYKPFIKWFLIIIYPVTYTNAVISFLYPILILITFTWEAVAAIVEVRSKTLKRPILTLKASFIVAVVLFLQFFLLNFRLFDTFFWVLVLDKLLPVFIAMIVLFLSLPTELDRDRKILEAVRLISRHKKLLVIGVTGSYGKSSTKEFIGQILSFKFKVLKTLGTNNTPIGVANAIISGLEKDTEIFVVEMGAYKKGEIASICNIVHPKIGILTGISPQHLSLFGSIDNIMEGKYELIESLPKKDGLSIFNGNNPYCRKLFEKTKIKKLIYSFLEDSDIIVSNTRVNKLDVSFSVRIGKDTINIRAKLLGKHNVENLLPAILIGQYLGMNLAEIKEAVSQIDYLPMTMKPYQTNFGVNLIDDTFNASPDSVLSAIDYLGTFGKKRILVLQPMIELGNEARKAHYELGRVAGAMTSRIYLTNKSFSFNFKKGAQEVGRTKVEVLTPQEIAASVKNITTSGDVVVFEGKEAGLALKLLKDEL